jgi:iron complex outermembrane receptor protein
MAKYHVPRARDVHRARSSGAAFGFILSVALPGAALSPASVWADTPADTAALAEIVVTAQRREESQQKTSLALQVLSSQELADAGVVQVRDLTSVVPGLEIGQGGNATQIYIRGVGDFGATPITNPAVAFNVDGVYVARSQAVEGNMYDIARIEVLKGPQGTLYGRNASGGAINVITNKPSLDAFGGYGELEVGNYGEVMVNGAVNLPVNSQFAVRASVQDVSRNGYLSDGGDDDHHRSGRLQALWKNDVVSALLVGEYTHVGGVGPDYAALTTASRDGGSPWTEVLAPSVAAYYYQAAAAQGYCIPGGFFPGVVNPGKCPALAPYPAPPFPPGTLGPYTSLVTYPTGQQYTNNQFWNVHSDIEVDLGFATLTLLPAVQAAQMNYDSFPLGLHYADDPDTSKAESFEARLGNSSQQLKWVGGLYYFHQTQDSSEIVDGGLYQNNNYVDNQSTRSAAAFGELTFSLTDATRLIAGARYTNDRRTIDGSVTAIPPTVAFLPTPETIGCYLGLPNPCLLETYTGDKTFTKFTWKLGVEQDLSPMNMLFATLSTGFKAGGFDESAGLTAGSHEALSFNPESLTAFELGSRNRFLDNRLQINAEAFYWKYKDHQEPRITVDGFGTLSFDYENAGDATLYGLDLDLIAKPTLSDTVRATVEYLHSVYNTFAYDVPLDVTGAPFVRGAGNGFSSFNAVSPLAATTACNVSTITTGALAGGAHVDCSGFPLTHAPRWSGSLGYDHRFGLAGGYSITLAAQAQFATSRYIAIDFLPQELAPSYVSENAYLTLASARDKWSIGLFGRNLSNRAIYTGAYEGPIGSIVAADIEPPRTYGARVRVNF